MSEPLQISDFALDFGNTSRLWGGTAATSPTRRSHLELKEHDKNKRVCGALH